MHLTNSIEVSFSGPQAAWCRAAAIREKAARQGRAKYFPQLLEWSICKICVKLKIKTCKFVKGWSFIVSVGINFVVVNY